MKDKNEKGGMAQQRGVSPIAAGVMGAVAGATMGAAAGMILSQEKNRKKVAKAMKTISKNAPILADRASKKVQELRSKAMDMMDAGKQTAKSKKIAKKITKKAKV